MNKVCLRNHYFISHKYGDGCKKLDCENLGHFLGQDLVTLNASECKLQMYL